MLLSCTHIVVILVRKLKKLFSKIQGIGLSCTVYVRVLCIAITDEGSQRLLKCLEFVNLSR